MFTMASVKCTYLFLTLALFIHLGNAQRWNDNARLWNTTTWLWNTPTEHWNTNGSFWNTTTGLSLTPEGLPRFNVGIGKDYDNGNTKIRAGGFVDTKGNWGAAASFRFRFKRELARKSDKWIAEHFSLFIAANPCFFDVYDTNGDGSISKEDLYVVFDDDELANKFFDDLDITTGDGTVDKAEFNLMAPIIIRECEGPRGPMNNLNTAHFNNANNT